MAKFDIQSLNLYYGTFQALKGIDLAIGENEITAFIGPSGCGKSTLLKTLDRMNDLVPGCRIEGKVLLDGEPVYENPAAKARMAYIPDELFFYRASSMASMARSLTSVPAAAMGALAPLARSSSSFVVIAI